MRAIESLERDLGSTRVFELAQQVHEQLDFLDAMHGHRHMRNPRVFFQVLSRIELRRHANGLLDDAPAIAAAFWSLVPPEER